MSDLQFINYNWMPTVADHVVDASEDFYKGAGVSRLHDKNSINPLEVKDGDIVFVKTDYIYHGEFQKFILPKIKNMVRTSDEYKDFSQMKKATRH